MYLPANAAQRDVHVLRDLMRARPLATLVVQGDDGWPSADHVPLLVEEDGPGDAQTRTVLRGHVARANTLWRVAGAGQPALAVFQDAEAYISPSWYPGKSVHGKEVPTWNYVAVHATGTLRAVDDAVWLRALLDRLTAAHEGPRAAPWQVGDAPPDYIERMLRAIVGIEFTVTSLVGKWKVSEQRPEDRDGVADGLDREGTPQAAAMARLVRAN